MRDRDRQIGLHGSELWAAVQEPQLPQRKSASTMHVFL